MFRTVTFAALLATLAACGDGQPFTFGEEPAEPVPEEPTPGESIPEVLAGNLADADYDAAAGTLTVTITSLDTTPVVAEYQRNPALDVPGYVAFSVQEDPLDRLFIGFGRRSNDGATQAVLAMDGGQFNRYFGGTRYEQLGAYSPHSPSQPDRGLVSYAGDYVGMLNLNAPRPNEALPVPGSTESGLVPGQAARVTGDVFLNADFADNTVNGAITDREMIDYGIPIVGLALIPTAIEENGTFFGDVEILGDTGSVLGSYGGTFGGTGATSVAGGVRLVGDFINDIDNEEEYGIFVLDQCGTPGDAPICDVVDP